MIKFFRHIRQQLIQENKMGKYFKYAIGEIILVVIGILIALQINTWNENRKNAAKETQLLTSFKNDILENKKELNRIIDKTGITIKAADSILQFESGDLNVFNLESFANCLLDATNYTVYMTQEGTIQDIMGSGNLGIITNDSLRLAIGSWNANLKLLRESEILDKNSKDDYTVYLRSHINFYEIDNQNLSVNEDIKNKLLKDRLFLNHISDRAHYPGVLNKIYKKEIPKLESLLRQIDQELEVKLH